MAEIHKGKSGAEWGGAYSYALRKGLTASEAHIFASASFPGESEPVMAVVAAYSTEEIYG